MLKKEEWPEVGELVVATVERVIEYGAYVRLDEYDKEGLLHISEMSSSWVRNIRDYAREGQKVVLKVLRVDPERKHVDLSLRRVTRRERTEKMLSWKRSRKVESLMRSASKKLGASIDEIYEKAGILMEKEFGDIYDGLEKAAKEGADVLMRVGVSGDLAAVLAEIAKEKIKIRMVKMNGTLNLTSTKPDGVLQIRKALLNAQNIERPLGAEINIHAVAAPRYRIEVLAHNYKEAEALLKQAVDVAIGNIKESGGQGSFNRS